LPLWDIEKVNPTTAPSLGGTSLYTLPKKGFLSGLLIRLSATRTAGGDLTVTKWRLLQTLTKIELILNGTYDAKSIDGELAEAIQWYDTKKCNIEQNLYDAAGGTSYDCVFLSFGRKPYDPLYGLDLEKYNSAELKITNDQSTTYWSAVAAEAVYALIQREPAVPPRGFIRSREYRKWTTVSDEWKYLDLPTEDKLRRVILQAVPPTTLGVETTSWLNMMYEIKYKIRSGAVSLFDANLDILSKMNALDYGNELLMAGLVQIGSARGIRIGVGRVSGWAGQDGIDAASNPTVPYGIKPTPDGCLRLNAKIADQTLGFLAKGIGPWETSVFNHDRIGDLSDLLDLAAEKVVTLDIHTRSGSDYADGTNKVVLETLVKY